MQEINVWEIFGEAVALFVLLMSSGHEENALNNKFEITDITE